MFARLGIYELPNASRGFIQTIIDILPEKQEIDCKIMHNLLYSMNYTQKSNGKRESEPKKATGAVSNGFMQLFDVNFV